MIVFELVHRNASEEGNESHGQKDGDQLENGENLQLVVQLLLHILNSLLADWHFLLTMASIETKFSLFTIHSFLSNKNAHTDLMIIKGTS